ncbi:MAG: hypothetical protein ACRDPC_17590 [Solirubrobacteraceae bacterium]
MADESRVRIQMVDGRHLEARGTLQDVAAKLAPESCGPHGFCEVQDTRGNAVLVNRHHVLYLERRGQTRSGLVR